jgi:hypothetical protein
MTHLVRGLAGAALVLAATPTARADGLEIVDVRLPARFGFAYTGITEAPAMSLSAGIGVDIMHLTKRLTFQVVFDSEANSRLDLPDTDARSSFGGLALGAGLFYVTEGAIGLGFESTTWLTFDAVQLVGSGFATRAYVYPFYLSIEDATKHHGERFVTLAKSSIALWVMGRVDWADDGRGGTLAFGVSLDLARIFFVPYFEALMTKFK